MLDSAMSNNTSDTGIKISDGPNLQRKSCYTPEILQYTICKNNVL